MNLTLKGSVKTTFCKSIFQNGKNELLIWNQETNEFLPNFNHMDATSY